MIRDKCKLPLGFVEPRPASSTGPNDYLARVMADAKTTFDRLVRELGGVCAWCGDDGRYSPLTIDHVNGITWDRNNFRYDARVKRYWKEYQEGVPLRVLCRVCNSIDGRTRQMNASQSGASQKP